MCTSDINTNQKTAARTSLIYLIVALFCAFFGAIYERYSHEVYSYYMIYAFAFPLVGGTLPFHILSLSKSTAYPRSFARNLYHSGIATLTVGSVVRGILDIYGTTNSLSGYYWILGGLLVPAAICIETATRFHRSPDK